METKLRALDQAHHRMVERHVKCLVKFDKICTGFPKYTGSCEQRVLFLLVVLNVHFLQKQRYIHQHGFCLIPRVNKNG